MSCEKSLLIVVAEAVLSSIERRANDALVPLDSMMELRSGFESDMHRPR